MVYARKRSTKRTYRRRSVRKSMRSKRSALGVAKKALKLASQVANASTEIKYLSYSTQSDVAGSGDFLNSAVSRELTFTGGTTPLFMSDGLTGDKAFCKYVKGTWEIHMDNTNNEEETCNFTVAVVKFKQDADQTLFSGTLSNHVSVIQGQTYFDPRMIKVLYYKHFTLTMGGTSPGTSGQMLKKGRFYIPVNKMIRLSQEGVAGQQTSSVPMSAQDKIFFLVYTDNTALDTENPRINYRTLSVYRDNDINY